MKVSPRRDYGAVVDAIRLDKKVKERRRNGLTKAEHVFHVINANGLPVSTIEPDMGR